MFSNLLDSVEIHGELSSVTRSPVRLVPKQDDVRFQFAEATSRHECSGSFLEGAAVDLRVERFDLVAQQPAASFVG